MISSRPAPSTDNAHHPSSHVQGKFLQVHRGKSVIVLITFAGFLRNKLIMCPFKKRALLIMWLRNGFHYELNDFPFSDTYFVRRDSTAAQGFEKRDGVVEL